MESSKYDVYVSFNNNDVPLVTQLVRRLEAEGIKVWWTEPDKFTLSPGQKFTDIAREAISRSTACAVLLGATGLGPLQEQEVLKVVLDHAEEDKQFVVLPVLLPGSNPGHLPPPLRERGWIDFRNGLANDEVFRKLLAGIWNAKTVGGAVHLDELFWKSPLGERFRTSEKKALEMAGRLGIRGGRLADSALFLAVILRDASETHGGASGRAVARALAAQRSHSSTPVDERDLLQLDAEYRFDQLPRVPSSDDPKADAPREIFITNELATFLQYADEFAKRVPKGDSVYTRHILGTVLTTDPSFPSSAARVRLVALGYNLDEARQALLEFVTTRGEPETHEMWKKLLTPAQSEETPVEVAPEVKTAEESILNASVSDQPTADDTLGFDPYVKAIADFLTNEKTEPPLTMSVEGEWGAGKSSFMLQLERELRARVFTPKILMLMRERRTIRIRRERIPTPLRRFRLLRQSLIVPPDVRRELQKLRCPTVRFNAWRHDKEDALWASFALEFLRKLSGELPALQRRAAYLKLLNRRFRWSAGWPTLLRALIVALVFISITFVFIAFLAGDFSTVVKANPASLEGDTFVDILKASGIAGYVAVTLFFITKLRDFVGDPFAADLKQFIEAPNYDTHVAFIEHFHEDFRKIVETYAGRNKVYVFIDDLDRCDVPKAADLMQALNLMIADSPQLIFIMGIDREKVAAGLAVKYEKLLPYLTPAVEVSGVAPNARGFDPAPGLSYGYTFIEKFIQLPFRIPQPAKNNLKQLLDKISPLEDGEQQAAVHSTGATRLDATLTHSDNGQPLLSHASRPGASLDAYGADVQRQPAYDSSGARNSAVISGQTQGTHRTPQEQESGAASVQQQRQDELKESIRLAVTRDSMTVRRIVLMVAPTLEYNPRRLKQFINMFRLKSLIAAETGLFKIDAEGTHNTHMTLEKLGKFVAISLKWPRVLDDLDADRRLLSDLQKWASGVGDINTKSVPARYWASHPDSPVLKKLLLYGCDDDLDDDEAPDADAETYSLEGLEVDKLLQVSPRLARPAKPPEAKTQTVPPETETQTVAPAQGETTAPSSKRSKVERRARRARSRIFNQRERQYDSTDVPG